MTDGASEESQGVTPAESSATQGSGSEFITSSQYAESQARWDAKFRDLTESFGRFKKQVKGDGGSPSEGGAPESGRPSSDSSLSRDDIVAMRQFDRVFTSLPEKTQAKLTALENDGMTYPELVRMANVLKEVSADARPAATPQRGHAGTAAQTPADADVPTTPDEVRELLSDPDRKARFLKKHPGFDFQKVMFKDLA